MSMAVSGPAQNRPGRSFWTRLIFLAPLVVPILWATFVLMAQPANELGIPRRFPWVGFLLYDDYDFSAMVLRGLNANAGRLAGTVGEPPVDPEAFKEGLHSPRPWAARYHLEYPHTALVLFRLAAWFGNVPPNLSVLVLDNSYHDIVNHKPEEESDIQLAAGFRRAIRFLIVIMTASLLGLVLTLHAGYLPGGGLQCSGLLLLLPGAFYFSLFRFDVIPTLLTALSLACLGRQRWLAAGAFLGLAALVKVYPVLLVPLILRYLWGMEPSHGGGWRAALLWLVGCGGVVALCLLPPLWTSGWEAVWSPYHFQLNREPFLWTMYGYFLPQSLSENTALAKGFRLGVLLVTGFGLAIWPVVDLTSLLRRGAVVLIVFISLAVVFSPQWILWLTPFVLPLAARSRWLTFLVIGLDLVTFLLWPYIIGLPAEWKAAVGFDPLRPGLNYLRCALFAALSFTLLGAEIWSRRSVVARARSVSSACTAA
jgi:hypothetical protein